MRKPYCCAASHALEMGVDAKHVFNYFFSERGLQPVKPSCHYVDSLVAQHVLLHYSEWLYMVHFGKRGREDIKIVFIKDVHENRIARCNSHPSS